MSKDRQQRREQQANVKDGDRTPGRFQVADLAKAQADLPTMSAFELDTLGMRLPEVMKRGAGEDDGEFRARLSARLFVLVPQPDRALADIIEHAERLGCGIVEPEYENPVDRAALIASLPPVAPLVSCPTCVGQGKVPKPEADRLQQEPAKPPVNLPKAVHHLRKAANALQGDVFQIVVLDCARGVIGGGFDGIAMARIAAALDLDHNTKGAAADVRAAIEALS